MNIPTEFAPAERSAVDCLEGQCISLSKQPSLLTALNTMLNYVLVLNEQRQIVFASDNFMKLMPPGKGSPIGLRPGEALGCRRAYKTEGGCGTTAFCRECGAVKAVMASFAGKSACEECKLVRIAKEESQSLDLLVNTQGFELDGWLFSLVAIADISHEKRRRALERIFFHDVLNTAGGIAGLASLLAADVPAELRPDAELLQNGLNAVLEEILAQRDLSAAENHELVAHRELIQVQELLGRVVKLYERHPAALDRNLQFDGAGAVLEVISDRRLLQRVVGNMIKNALEASFAGQCVTVECKEAGDVIIISVHNETAIPRPVQAHVFNRSFSTKGKDRGLGTYSIKLLTEGYLKGTVGFTSSDAEGTTFVIELPKKPAQSTDG